MIPNSVECFKKSYIINHTSHLENQLTSVIQSKRSHFLTHIAIFSLLNLIFRVVRKEEVIKWNYGSIFLDSMFDEKSRGIIDCLDSIVRFKQKKTQKNI
jgi:hypothetical protein